MSAMSPDDWCCLETLDDTLIIAPPGCGKTELLARRAGVCVERGILPKGRKILALTFTNKARDNLASRMTEHVGASFRRHVAVINFHGLGLHLYRRHRYVLDDPVRELLPDDRVLRSLERKAFEEFSVPRGGEQDVRLAIREAKAGPFSDIEVIARLERSGSAAALWYERRLQSESRMDHDDVLRFGLRIIQNDGVAAVYSERYAYVLIDEAQDLTCVQYDMVEPIGHDCTVFAGDRAQGIYTFAGADPDWVFARIHDRNPLRVQLDKSYRSSPEVLAIVSAVAAELGSPELTSAVPQRWVGRGRTRLATFDDQVGEAAWLIQEITAWREKALTEQPPRQIAIGVLTRMKPGGRRDVFLDCARTAGLDVETWDHPLHRPEVVRLLGRHLDAVLMTVADPARQVEELHSRCLSEVQPENASTLIDLRDAADELLDSIRHEDLRTLIERIRIGSDTDVPVGPGIHVLTGHAGKGQGFDVVVVLGFEEGQIPSFFVKGLPDSDPGVREELALLHVMTSRAKEELVFTICRTTKGYRQQPSRWLKLIEKHVERVA